MKKSENVLKLVSLGTAPAKIADSVPADCYENLIIIRSLAVGYRFLANKVGLMVRTKDGDCPLSPRAEAMRV